MNKYVARTVYYIAGVHDYEHTTAKHRQGSTHDFIRAAKGLLLHEEYLIDQLCAICEIN